MISKSQPLTVVVSRTNSKNPAKAALEDAIANALVDSGFTVYITPNLYDLKLQGEALQCVSEIEGDFVVCAWMYERAAHWILDRNNVRGKIGAVELQREDEDDDELDDLVDEDDDKSRVADDRQSPNRSIFCIDLRIEAEHQPYVDEIRRIAAAQQPAPLNESGTASTEWLAGQPTQPQLDRFLNPVNAASDPANANLQVIEENAARRWYPVIDFSRCTNCMECIDFCLFGVYGVDTVDTILVEQPDNCRKGCPACSRVCPENAIIFPQHKTPTIAGAPSEAGGLKIDLSLLFGAPDAQDVAAKERDEQLRLAGREPVGADDLQKRQTNEEKPKDELDALIDGLDDLDV